MPPEYEAGYNPYGPLPTVGGSLEPGYYQPYQWQPNFNDLIGPFEPGYTPPPGTLPSYLGGGSTGGGGDGGGGAVTPPPAPTTTPSNYPTPIPWGLRPEEIQALITEQAQRAMNFKPASTRVGASDSASTSPLSSLLTPILSLGDNLLTTVLDRD